MNEKELEAFAREAAKGLKTEKELNEFSQMLTKITVEVALNAELDEYLGYDKFYQIPIVVMAFPVSNSAQIKASLNSIRFVTELVVLSRN